METRLLTVTHAKAKRVNRRRPTIKMLGGWLDEIGFTAGKLVAGEYSSGKIILRLLDSGNCQDSEKGAFKAGSGLFQVRRQMKGQKHYSEIDMTGFWLERFGFTIGGVVAARYEYGLIKLLLIDPERFQE
jgi:hypothetical protein